MPLALLPPMLSPSRVLRCCISTAIVCACASTAPAAEPNPHDLEFFEQKIRPVLVEKCYECHSAEAAKGNKLKGNLLLDTREGSRRGGDSGPAVVPGKIDESLIVSALKHESFIMPPTSKLSAAVAADFEHWIQRGAPDPREGGAGKVATIDFEKARREHWAFQPMQQPSPPAVQNKKWVRNEIDAFVLAKLEEKNLAPSVEAGRTTWLRRVTFDLIGLPPSPEEIAAFVDDRSPDAFERVVDRLLDSPHYGERWGRHWLDLARYADSSGFHNDLDRPNAWKYRDYVIESFNADRPYAQFVIEQLAGDEIAGADEQSRIATGFNCNGPSNEDNVAKDAKSKERYRLDQLDDVISTVATVYLGLTVGCARCHDHKIDPISAEDYYRFLAVFNNTEKHGPPMTDSQYKKLTPEKRPKFQGLIETSAKIRPTYLLRRGNLDFPAGEVQPGVPTVLAARSIEFPAPGKDAKTTGRRRTLAEWIAAPTNPLTYRVLANRLWQHHFGRGIVATPSNFGFGGAKPTHPELLDYLAQKIIADGGRLKPTQRAIVLSATYRQTSAERGTRSAERSGGASAAQIDPDNSLLWRQNKQRLEAEAIRDAILTASGKLNPQRNGPGIKPRIRAELLDASKRNQWPVIEKEGPAQWRRSVYIYVKRQLLMPMMELFDAPTTTESTSSRQASIVPTQALLLMNDEFIEDQSKYLAERVFKEAIRGNAAVERIFLLTLSAPPSQERLDDALAFLAERKTAYADDGLTVDEARVKAWADLAHVLFNSNQFVFVE